RPLSACVIACRAGLQSPIPPFPLPDAVLDEVFVPLPLLRMLPAQAFPGHAELLHDPPRRRVTQEVRRVHTVQVEITEGVLQHGKCRLGAVAAPPERPADPVAELTAVRAEVEPDTYGTDQSIVSSQHYREGRGIAGLE